MKKDGRLYGKFSLDFPDSHKIMPLSDAAFRCLVEATLWSRKQLSDGLLPSRYAVARWGLDVLQELASNDASNPSLMEVEGGWLIHDFAAHQDTRAEVEARSERNKLAGQKGGQAKAKQTAKRTAKHSASTSLSENVAETETETYKEQPARFDDFWAAYPRKVGRKEALKAYTKALDDIDADKLVSAARAYTESVRGSEARFIAHPTTWLNQGRWDEFTITPRTPEELLRDCWKRGTCSPITELTGHQPGVFRWPEPEPDDFDADAARIEWRRDWITVNHDTLIASLRGAM